MDRDEAMRLIDAIYDEHFHRLNFWEVGFIGAVAARLDRNFELSENQGAKLAELEGKYLNPRRAAGRPAPTRRRAHGR